jgi:hypothetical protein
MVPLLVGLPSVIHLVLFVIFEVYSKSLSQVSFGVLEQNVTAGPDSQDRELALPGSHFALLLGQNLTPLGRIYFCNFENGSVGGQEHHLIL